MKKHSLLMTLAMLTLIAISLPSPATAKDAVTATVPDPETQSNLFSGHVPVAVMNNGNPLSPGTFAVGTIQLFYEIGQSELGSNPLLSFPLTLGIKPSSTSNGQATIYPATVNLVQTGSQYLTVTPIPASVTINPAVAPALWPNTVTINVSVPPAKLGEIEVDDDLVGNLQLQVSEPGHFLDTPTSIQIHILVTEDAGACIQVYNFLTDMEFTTLVTSTNINVSNSPKGPKISGTNPFGQFSNNILVVNDCAEAQTFDLQITPDSHFELKGHNAVATYLAGGYTDPSQFDIDFFGTGTVQGQNLLLTDITVPPDSSFLVTVHIGLINQVLASTLPVNGCFDGFSAELLVPGTDPNSLTPVILFTMAEPNPAATQMTFTIQ